MEAIHTNEGYQAKKNIRKGTRVSLWKMAVSNVGRNKKRVVFVVLSLSFSLIILNGAYTMADSFDEEKYLSDMITHDFVMGDASWFNVYAHYVDQDTVGGAFLEELREMQGIESLGTVYFAEEVLCLDEHWKEFPAAAKEELNLSGRWLEHLKEEYAQGYADAHVYGLDDVMWSELKVYEGSIDLEKLKSGKYAVVSAYDSEGRLSVYHAGDSVEVTVWNQDTESYDTAKEYEVLAVANIPYAISIKHTHPLELGVFLPSGVFLEEIEKKAPMIATMDVGDGTVAEFEAFLKDYSENRDKSMQYESRGTYLAEYENTQRTYRMIGVVACVLLAFIGIANFTNTVLTSIVTRKKELALLQAVGMTASQQRKMLIIEGVFYLFLTICVVATAGNLLVSAGLNMMLGSDGYFTVRPTVIPSLVCMPTFFVLTAAIPVLGQAFMCKKTVVDRLRGME